VFATASANRDTEDRTAVHHRKIIKKKKSGLLPGELAKSGGATWKEFANKGKLEKRQGVVLARVLDHSTA